MMDQTVPMNGPSVVDGLLQRIQHKAGVRRPADAPAHNVAGVDVDHEGNVDEPAQVATYVKLEIPSMFGTRA